MTDCATARAVSVFAVLPDTLHDELILLEADILRNGMIRMIQVAPTLLGHLEFLADFLLNLRIIRNFHEHGVDPAEERDVLGLISIMTTLPVSGSCANWILVPPITPILSTTL